MKSLCPEHPPPSPLVFLPPPGTATLKSMFNCKDSFVILFGVCRIPFGENVPLGKSSLKEETSQWMQIYRVTKDETERN